MKVQVGNTGRGRRKGLFAKMQAGTVQPRWTKIAVRVKGKFASKFVLGCLDGDKFIGFGQFDTLEALMDKAKSSRLSTPVNGQSKAA